MKIKDVIDFVYSHTDEDFIIMDCQILEELADDLKNGNKPIYSLADIEGIVDDILNEVPIDDEMKKTLNEFVNDLKNKFYKENIVEKRMIESNNASFYVMDVESGIQIDDDLCGCMNDFDTYSKASKVAKEVSLHNEGKYTVSVMVSSDYWENGKKYTD